MSETAIAFAGAGRASVETVIAFAGAKCAVWVCFSVAEVMAVSMVAVLGRALVMVVSRGFASAVAVVMVVSMVAVQGRAAVLSVSMSPRCRALCAKKFALRGHNGPKLVFSGVLGEFFRGRAAGGVVSGEFFRDPAAVGSHGASCVVPRPW